MLVKVEDYKDFPDCRTMIQRAMRFPPRGYTFSEGTYEPEPHLWPSDEQIDSWSRGQPLYTTLPQEVVGALVYLFTGGTYNDYPRVNDWDRESNWFEKKIDWFLGLFESNTERFDEQL